MTMSNITGMVGGALTLIGWYSFKPMLIILGGIISLGGGLISMCSSE